jgi:hypothetical protein
LNDSLQRECTEVAQKTRSVIFIEII